MSNILKGLIFEEEQTSYSIHLKDNDKPLLKYNSIPELKSAYAGLTKKYPDREFIIKKTSCSTTELGRPEFLESAQKISEEELNEDLRKWFKEKWVRFGPDGKIRGDCARGDDSEGKPKCLPQSKAHSLGKKGRKYAASKKRREDPNPERSGKAINVTTKKKSNEGVAEGSEIKMAKGHGDVVQGTDVKTIAKSDLGKNKLNLPQGYGDVVQPQKLKTIAKAKGVAEGELDEACWKGYHKEGNKKMFGKTYPNCVKNEDVAEGSGSDKKYTIKKSYTMSRSGVEKAVWNIMYGDEVVDTTSRRSDAKFYADKWNASEKEPSSASQKTSKSDVAEGSDKTIWVKPSSNHTLIVVKSSSPDIEVGEEYDEGDLNNYANNFGYEIKDRGVAEESCPHCAGPMFSEALMMEKKDACYYKVKSRYKVWPSAYASGALVKCRNKGASNWGNKSESAIMRGLQSESLGTQYPTTYEEENEPFKSKGQRRTGTLTTEEELDEKWSNKYKRSIDCSNPKGFSQRAHCQGKKK